VAAPRSICVFCGSASGTNPAYAAVAAELGALLADRGIELVYGGGHVGLMGVLADACMARGGTVVGVIPVGLFTEEIAHRGITVLHEVASMHDRKVMMYRLADAFLALPGGLGTLEELAESVTWSQLGLHAKPAVLVDIDGFWQPLLAQLDHMVDVGFLKPKNRALIAVRATPEDALAYLTA
jgi:uncharacterized protein (TIGR00730 family)